MGLPAPAAVLVDLDETLFDNSFVGEALAPTIDAILARTATLNRQDLVGCYNAASDRIWPTLGPRCITGEVEALQVSHAVWRQALDSCGIADRSLVDFAHSQHQRLLTAMSRVFDDVPGFLAALDHTGIPSAVVTNGSVGLQRSKLAAVGLENRFAVVVISGEIGTPKPDPSIFGVALDRLDLPSSTAVWHIGDSLDSDIAGAHAAGIHGIWLNRKGTPPGAAGPAPAATIRSLTELTEVLLRQ